MINVKNFAIDLAIAAIVAIVLGWSATSQPQPASRVKEGGPASSLGVTQAPPSMVTEYRELLL